MLLTSVSNLGGDFKEEVVLDVTAGGSHGDGVCGSRGRVAQLCAGYLGGGDVSSRSLQKLKQAEASCKRVPVRFGRRVGVEVRGSPASHARRVGWRGKLRFGRS